MNCDMIISINENINDPLAMGNVSAVSQILMMAEQTVKAGHKVIVQRQYSNAAPDILSVLTKPEEICDWREKLNNNQDNRGRKKIF